MSATVVINGRGIGVSEKVREYAEKKIGKLDHYLPEIGEVRVDLSAERTARDADDRQVVQITVPLRGTILRSEERSADLFTGLDVAVDRLQRQIERYKSKHRHSRGNGSDLGQAALEAEADVDLTPEAKAGPAIVRRKKFLITPMTEAEAIEQMALSAHEDFFIFYNADTARINVLYLRKDGDYGLIEPDAA
jgi:putative sigma-54 modulation protein